jgi:uncharacterized OB-fold protein
MSDQSNVIVIDGEWRKPYPSIDLDNAPFWAGLREHKFMLWRCKTCGAWYWPKAYCLNHENEDFAENMEWVEASGRGKIFTFNRHFWAFHPGFKDELPYIYALIELDEGPMISSQLVGAIMPSDVYHIGQPVEVIYEDHPQQEFTLPKFRIISSAQS